MTLSRQGRINEREATAVFAALVLALAACASPIPPELEDRIRRAEAEQPDDPAIQARLAEVEAALERERGVAPIDDIEFRVGGRWDGDQRVRLLSRIPVPDPRRLRSQRAARRADTETAVARLEETVLERSSEECFWGVLSGLHRERLRLYEPYAERQNRLLDWSEEGRRSGARNEWSALRFSIERKVRLAERIPEPPATGLDPPADLPAIGESRAPLRSDPALIEQIFHPGPPGHQFHFLLQSRR